ncbi:MAG: hypothetical protein Q7R85_02325 [bacterium]|nr:hypothetical protein [bacterium]
MKQTIAALLIVITMTAVGVCAVLLNRVANKNITQDKNTATNVVEANASKTTGFTIPAEAMPTSDTYFVTIIKGHGENDGIWVLGRPLSTVTEKAGFTLIMEAAKKGDAKHYPLPDELKPNEKK